MDLIRRWHESGVQVLLILTSRQTPRALGNDVPIGVELVCLLGPIESKIPSPFRHIYRILRMRALVMRYRPNIILSFIVDSNILSLLATLGSGIETVVSERSFPPSEQTSFFRRILRKYLYRNASKVVLLTERTLDWYRSEVGETKNAVVIPNSVGLNTAKQENLTSTAKLVSQRARTILGIGRLVKEKRFDLLMTAFSSIKHEHPGWRLVIVGDGPERSRLDALRQRLQIEDAVFLTGYTTTVNEWLADSQVYVLSSRYEGFPNTLLEAMAHGCACIATDCDTGPRVLINHGSNGILLPAECNETTLASSLSNLLADSALRDRLGQEARAVLSEYSTERIGQQWDTLVGL